MNFSYGGGGGDGMNNNRPIINAQRPQQQIPMTNIEDSEDPGQDESYASPNRDRRLPPYMQSNNENEIPASMMDQQQNNNGDFGYMPSQ